MYNFITLMAYVGVANFIKICIYSLKPLIKGVLWIRKYH